MGMAKHISNARIGARARNGTFRTMLDEPAVAGPRNHPPTQSASLRQLAQVKARHSQLYGYKGQKVPSADKSLPAEGAPPEQTTSTRTMSNMSAPRLMTLAKPPFAVRALNNMSYGATPTTIAEFNALGSTDAQRLANWVDWQLDWG